MSETNYLKLKYITLMSTRWFQDFNSNLARLDLLGKAVRTQQGAGLSMGLRCELSDGTLVEMVRAVPNSNSGVDLFLGRPNSGDRVVVQAPTGGIGSRVAVEGLSMALGVKTASVWTAVTGDAVCPAGTWDLQAQAAVRVRIATAATAHPQLQILVGLFATGGALPISTARFTADMVTAVDGTRDFYSNMSVWALNAPGGTTYTMKISFQIINASFVQGDGTAVSFGLDGTNQPQNHILATRVA